jgi:hypothetical protein
MRFLIALSSRSMSRQSYGGIPITASGPVNSGSSQLVGIPEPVASRNECRAGHFGNAAVFFAALMRELVRSLTLTRR